jgi:hypothetical protein
MASEESYFEQMSYSELDDLVKTVAHLAELSLEVTAALGMSPEVVYLLEQIERLIHLTRPAVTERSRRRKAGAALVGGTD